MVVKIRCVNCYALCGMEDRAPVIGQPTASLQTGESEKVHILGVQRMCQRNQWCLY
jgi:hypothetical protein